VNLDSMIGGRDLRELHDAFARQASAAWIPVRTSTRFARTVRTEDAERELARVHVIEVARLLREAALLRRAERDAEAVELVAWRRRARREIARWRVDGFESPATLRSCAARPIDRWAPAREIAREALAIDPSESARHCLACVES
jgi:hypothetical protein